MINRQQVTTFAVNSNNDLYVNSSGNIAFAHDEEAIGQACRQVALTLLGEMVLQTDQGIPYQTAIWVGVPNVPAFEAALRGGWLGVNGVVSIMDLTISLEPFTIPTTGKSVTALSYSATINTTFGTVDIARENIFNG
jgi:hypothetical protein